MSGKIKVALCLSGEPRSSMFCFPYIYESFLNIGKDYNIDVFIHTRKNYRAVPLFKPTAYKLDPPKTKNIIGKYNINLNSLPSKLSENTEFHHHFSVQSNFITNQLLMLEGIYESFKLSTQNYSPYDIYIRLRPDIMTDHNLNLSSIIINILNQKYDLFIPSKSFDPKKKDYKNSSIEYNDQLAIGNFKSMEIYSNMIFYVRELLTKTEKWNAEKWLKVYLENSDIKINSHWLPFYLVRGIQAYTNRDFPQQDLIFLDQ